MQTALWFWQCRSNGSQLLLQDSRALQEVPEWEQTLFREMQTKAHARSVKKSSYNVSTHFFSFEMISRTGQFHLLSTF